VAYLYIRNSSRSSLATLSGTIPGNVQRLAIITQSLENVVSLNHYHHYCDYSKHMPTLPILFQGSSEDVSESRRVSEKKRMILTPAASLISQWYTHSHPNPSFVLERQSEEGV
jgi:hypothetical protein